MRYFISEFFWIFFRILEDLKKNLRGFFGHFSGNFRGIYWEFLAFLKYLFGLLKFFGIYFSILLIFLEFFELFSNLFQFFFLKFLGLFFLNFLWIFAKFWPIFTIFFFRFLQMFYNFPQILIFWGLTSIFWGSLADSWIHFSSGSQSRGPPRSSSRAPSWAREPWVGKLGKKIKIPNQIPKFLTKNPKFLIKSHSLFF